MTAVLALSGIGLTCTAVYLKTDASAEKSKPIRVAELASGSRMVLARSGGGRSEWQEVKAGALFSEGDLIQTERSGSAVIRYFNGTTIDVPGQTIVTVNPAGNLIEITVPPQIESAASPVQPAFSEETGSQPFLQLQRIVAFGRALELIGRVEPGTDLTVNDDIVEVAGDGRFKHFTAPFPASVHQARLVLKGVDLAGRARLLTAIYSFSTGRGE